MSEQTQLDTAFWLWFDGSKVVDAQGQPLRVYHSGFFDETVDAVPEIGPEGFHFGTKAAAEERNAGKAVDDFIRALKVDQDEDTGRWHWESGGVESYDLNEEGFETEAEARADGEQSAVQFAENSDTEPMPLTEAYLLIHNPKRMRDQKESWAHAIEKAKEEGHDGIVYRNEFEDKGKDSWIVFHPYQIKSVKNDGSWDKDDPSIASNPPKLNKAFKRWFGASKVINADGTPRIVYHGTNREFQAFEVGIAGKNSNVFGSWEAQRAGIFFAEDRRFAEVFAQQEGKPTGRVLEVYLSVQNPIDLRDGFTIDQVEQLEAQGLNIKYYSNLNVDEVWEAFDFENDGLLFVAALKNLGYDGAWISDSPVAGSPEIDLWSWVVFDPTQIKSVKNDGSWDKDDPSIASNPPKLNKAFWKWFGESKIVDAEGKPLVVYHGSKSKVSRFEISAGGEYGRGIYFTADPNTAWKFAEWARGPGDVQIHPVYLSIKHPFEATREQACAYGPRRLMSMGYDGIIGTAPSGEVQYVVFNANQIKSATGNDGTWDADDPDIRSNPMYPETEEKFEMANPAAPAVSGYEGMRVEYTPAKKLPFAQPFREPQDIQRFAMANRLTDDSRERFYTVYMNQQNLPLGYRLIGAGGPSSAPVDPAVVFGPAMALQASSVLFLHNHPSGTARFSPQDVALTERLLWVSRLMGLRVLDHILVVPSGGSLSMREEYPNLMWDYDPAARTIVPMPELQPQAAEIENAVIGANPGTDVEELALGTLHEMEHTDDPEAARQIALDHLAEYPHYYSHLMRCFGHSNPIIAENPPWVDKILASNWDAIFARMQQLHGDEAKLWMPEWTEPEGKRKKVVLMPELGCGHYGCVYETDGSPYVVVKVTTDATEATFIAIMEKLKREGWEPPRGIVQYYGIYALHGKAKRSIPYILWRELAIEAGYQKTLATIYAARTKDEADTENNKHVRRMISKAFNLIMEFKEVSHLAFMYAHDKAKKIDAPQYYAWLAQEKEAGDTYSDQFWDTWNGLGDKFGHFPDPYSYDGKYKDLLKNIFFRYKDHRIAWYTFVCRRIAEEMTGTDICYLIGEALNEFMDQDLLLADVHLENIGIVASANRNDNDMPMNIPVIIDPGHVVPLSDRYAQVEVEMI